MRTTERNFRRWLLAYLNEHQGITTREAIASGAEFVGCSILTATGYLAKLTSITGPLTEALVQPRPGRPPLRVITLKSTEPYAEEADAL